MRKKTQVYRPLDPCIMSCESRAVHISYILRSGSLFQMWMGCKHGHYRVFFIYTHYRSVQTSFISEEGQPTKSDFGRAGSRQMFLVPTQIKPWVAWYTDVTVLYVPLRFRGHSSIRFRYNRGKNLLCSVSFHLYWTDSSTNYNLQKAQCFVFIVIVH